MLPSAASKSSTLVLVAVDADSVLQVIVLYTDITTRRRRWGRKDGWLELEGIGSLREE
jgi:hypothetical protein